MTTGDGQLCHVRPFCLSVCPHGITQLPLEVSSWYYVLFLLKFIYRVAVGLKLGTSSSFILLVWEPRKSLKLQTKTSSRSHADAALAVTHPLIPSSFSWSRCRRAAMGIPAATYPPHPSPPPTSSCMDVWSVFGPWLPHCRNFHADELLRSKHFRTTSLQILQQHHHFLQAWHHFRLIFNPFLVITGRITFQTINTRGQKLAWKVWKVQSNSGSIHSALQDIVVSVVSTETHAGEISSSQPTLGKRVFVDDRQFFLP